MAQSKDVIIGIYEITSPSGKIYIGQSNDIERRFNTYRKLQKNRIGSALYASFLRYGVDKHRFRIICYLSEKADRHRLDHFEKLYIKAAKKIAPVLNLTDGGCGSWGYKHSDEVKKRLVQLGTGANSGKAKPIVQLDLAGNLIAEYCTISEASKIVGVSAPSISAALRGITHKAAGHKWQYKS